MGISKRLIVKCMSKSIQNGMYYKKKGEIINVKIQDNRFIAKIRMKDNCVLNIPQKALETVIPALGRKVKIVKWGKSSKSTLIGEVGLMVRISEDDDDEGATITMFSGPNKGVTITGVNYDYICKFRAQK